MRRTILLHIGCVVLSCIAGIGVGFAFNGRSIVALPIWVDMNSGEHFVSARVYSQFGTVLVIWQSSRNGGAVTVPERNTSYMPWWATCRSKPQTEWWMFERGSGWPFPVLAWKSARTANDPAELPNPLRLRMLANNTGVEEFPIESTRTPGRILWVGLLANTALGWATCASIVAMCGWIVAKLKSRRSLARACKNLCSCCGYPRGAVATCPECGARHL